MSATMPECMAPDGAQPCDAYTSLFAEARTLRLALRSIADATIDGVQHGMLSARQCHDIATKALQSSSPSGVNR